MKKKKHSPVTPHAVNSIDVEIEKIAAQAHRYYEEEGRPEGKAVEHWIRAERELREQKQADAAVPPRPIADPVTEEEMLDQAERKRA